MTTPSPENLERAKKINQENLRYKQNLEGGYIFGLAGELDPIARIAAALDEAERRGREKAWLVCPGDPHAVAVCDTHEQAKQLSYSNAPCGHNHAVVVGNIRWAKEASRE